MDAKKCGLFIQSIRKEKRLTQSELADLIGVTDKAISRWETGEGFPEITLLPKLSEILGVTIDELLKGERVGVVKKVNKNHITRFNLYSKLNYIGMFFGLVLSILVINMNTDKADAIWIGAIPLFIINFGTTICYIILRTLFIEKSLWNDEDKFAVYQQTKWIYSSLILTTFLYIPYIIGHYFYLSQQGWMIGIIRFDWYLLWAFFAVIIAVPIIYVINLIHRKNINYPIKKIDLKVNASLISVFIFVINFLFWLIDPISFPTITVIMFVNQVISLIVIIYFMVKKQISIKWLMLLPFVYFNLFTSLLTRANSFGDFGGYMYILCSGIVYLVLMVVAFKYKKIPHVYILLYFAVIPLTGTIPVDMNYLFIIYSAIGIVVTGLIENLFERNNKKALQI